MRMQTPERKMLLVGILAGLGVAMLISLWMQRLGPNVLRNPDFENGLTSWGWYTGNGAQAEFTTEAVKGAHGNAARINVLKTALYDSVEFRQTRITLQAGRKYTLSFLARSTFKQPLRIKIIKNEAPWSTYFRVITEVTPQWKRYHLTGRAMVSADDGKIMFQFGGILGDLWLDDIKFQECRGLF